MNASRSILASVGLALWLTMQACDEPREAPPATQRPDAGLVIAPQVALARIEAVKGTTTLERAGAVRPAAEEALFAHDAVETGAESGADIVFADGRRLALAENTRLAISGDARATVVNLMGGSLQSSTGPKRGSTMTLTVLTPFIEARLGADDEARFTANRGGTAIDVSLGEVELLRPDGGTGTARSFFVVGDPEVVATARPVRVDVESGGAEVRRAGSNGWKPLKRTGAETLGPGDQIRAGKGGARLGLLGASLALGRGSEARFEGAGGNDSAAGVRFDAWSGSVAVRAPPQRSFELAIPGLHLYSGRGSSFGLATRGEATNLDVFMGTVHAAGPTGAELLLLGNESLSLDRNGLRAAPLRAEALTLSPRERVRVFHSGQVRATATWEGDEASVYQVEAASDAAFTNLVSSGQVLGNRATLPTPQKGALHWRALRKGEAAGAGSAVFLPDVSARERPRSRNEVTDGAEQTTIYFQDKPPSVTFAWALEPGAVSYELKIFRDGELNTPAHAETSSEAKTAVPEGTLSEGRYFWSVEPKDARGKTLRGGKLNRLNLAYDNAVPDLILKSPRPNATVGASVALEGVVPLGARVFVNGKPLSLDESARFRSTVPTPTSGILVFRVVQRNGNETLTVRSVRGAHTGHAEPNRR